MRDRTTISNEVVGRYSFSRLTPNAQALYFHLCFAADDEGVVHDPAAVFNKAIADFCGCSESKVTKSISQLASIGYLQIKYFDGRERRMNIPPQYATLWRDVQDG